MNISIKKITEMITRNPNLLPIDKCILSDLYSYSIGTGEAYPSQETLAAHQNRTARYIRERLEFLKKEGWIISCKRRGYSKSNSYTLNKEIYFLNDKSNRNSSSSQLGTSVPLQSGNTVPANESNERNKLNGSYTQQVIDVFEKVAQKKCHGTDIKNLTELCEKYTPKWVYDAIREASTREIRYLSVSYVKLILEDWEKDGKPTPTPQKPSFVACGRDGCSGGYTFDKDGHASMCQCRIKYENEVSIWGRKYMEWYQNKKS